MAENNDSLEEITITAERVANSIGSVIIIESSSLSLYAWPGTRS